MSQTNLHPMLNIAVKAARAAGSIISRASMDVDRLTVTSKGSNDFVTEVDQAAEQAVIDILLQAYPGHGILAEESGREFGAQHSDYVWIIDPLDGTTNFIHGLPQYAVSIALAHKGKVEQAVVYDPAHNDLFYATKGRGAFLNDRRLRVSKRTRLLDCLIGTGFPFRKGDNFKRYLKMFEEVMQACAGVRRPGAAALDLCYVAAGWYDGFFETGLSPWDVAAGSLIITEAGGLVGNFTGEADFMNQREILAGNPKIYAQLVQMLSPYSRVIMPGEHAEAPGPDAVAALAQALAAAPLPAKKAVRVTRASLAAAAEAAPAVAPVAAPSPDAPAAPDVRAGSAEAFDPFIDAEPDHPVGGSDEAPAAPSTKAWIAEIPMSPAQALAAAFEPTPAADAPAPVVVRKPPTRIRKADLPVVETPPEAPRARTRPADDAPPRAIRSTHRDDRPARDSRPARDDRGPGGPGGSRPGSGRPAGKFAGKPPAKRGPR